MQENVLRAEDGSFWKPASASLAAIKVEVVLSVRSEPKSSAEMEKGLSCLVGCQKLALHCFVCG